MFSEQHTTTGSTVTSDLTSQAAHTYMLAEQAKSDGQGQNFAFVAHAYDDAVWRSVTSQNGTFMSSDVTTDTYSERLIDSSGLASFTQVHSETVSNPMPGNGQPPTNTTGWTTAGQFTLGDPMHMAQGGATMGGQSLAQVMAQYQALAQQAAQDLQRAIQACAASGRDSTSVVSASLQQVLNQILPAMQGLPSNIRDLINDRAGKVLVTSASVVGISMPAKLTGVASQPQRLEQMADYSVMFLNGMTFGTVDSLREESAQLAKKYGDAVYWVTAVAGAGAGVLAVVIGAAVTAATGGTAGVVAAIGGGAAFGLALGVGSQIAAMLDGTRAWGDFDWTEVASSTLLGVYFGLAMAVPGAGTVLMAQTVSDAVRGAAAAFRQGNVFTGLFDSAMVLLPVLLHGKKGNNGQREGVARGVGERPLAERSILAESGLERGPREYGRTRPGEPTACRSPLERGLDPAEFGRDARGGVVQRMAEAGIPDTIDVRDYPTMTNPVTGQLEELRPPNGGTGTDRWQRVDRTPLPGELQRPHIRDEVLAEVARRAPRDAQGRLIDANTSEAIEGTPDLGHQPGREF